MKYNYFFIIFLFFFTACGPVPVNDPYHLAEAKDKIGRGDYWYNRACYKEAARFYQESLDEARLSDNINLIITALNNLGIVYLAENKLNEAASFLEQSLNISVSTDNKTQMAYVSGNLGSLAYKADRLDDAESFWLKAIELADEEQQNPARFWCNLARLELDHNRGKNLNILVDKALELALKENSNFVLADAYNLKGRLLMKELKFREAEEYFKKSLVLDRAEENTIGLAKGIELIGTLQFKQGRTKEAFANLDRAFYLWAALGDFKKRDEIYSMILKLDKDENFYIKTEQYKEAILKPEEYIIKGRLCP